MSDDRKGLPSASGFPRYALCPGSFLAEKAVDWKEDADQAAESGTRIHAWLADANVKLNPEEQETADLCFALAIKVCAEVFQSDCGYELVQEQRLWFPNRYHTRERDQEMLYSGQYDAFYNDIPDRALVIDFKTGRNQVQADSSWQLRALAALVHENGLIKDNQRLFLAIIQPWASPQTKVVEYSQADLATAIGACEGLAQAVMVPGQPRIPSEEACRYCRAKATCPEALAAVERLAVMTLPDGRQGEVLDVTTLAELLDLCSPAERVIGSIRARAKTILAGNPDAIPGWQLRPGAIRQKITDVAGLWERMAPLGVLPGEFAAACGMSKTDFKALVRATQHLKGGPLDDKVGQLLQGLVEEKQTAPQLQRVGEQTAAITSDA